MNKVFLIDGAAGTGKSDLIRFVKDNLDNYDINIIKKNTTRNPRDREEAPEILDELTFFLRKNLKSWNLTIKTNTGHINMVVNNTALAKKN